MTGVERLAGLARPWADLYAGSAALSTTIEFLHLASLLVAGGFALAFDRAALRVVAGHTPNRNAFACELAAVHAPVLAGLAVVVLSGLALMAADVEALLPSPMLWAKMLVFALLLLNGAVIRRTGRRLEMDPRNAVLWRALRRGSLRSVSLWMLVLLLGVVLTAV